MDVRGLRYVLCGQRPTCHFDGHDRDGAAGHGRVCGSWSSCYTAATPPSSHVRGIIAVILIVRRSSISAVPGEYHMIYRSYIGFCFLFRLCIIHLLSCQLWLSNLHHLCPSFISRGRNMSAAFNPTYIFISCGRPQCSTCGSAAGLKLVPPSRAAALSVAQGWHAHMSLL